MRLVQKGRLHDFPANPLPHLHTLFTQLQSLQSRPLQSRMLLQVPPPEGVLAAVATAAAARRRKSAAAVAVVEEGRMMIRQ